MATASFDKNIVIREKEAVSKLVDILTKSKTKSFDEQLASDEAMTRSEEVLRSCLSRLKNS
jgi:hypothetical protein